jgi:hypothetical protein
MAVRINIIRRAGGGVEFVPASSTSVVASSGNSVHVPANERVFWCNQDPMAEHHIDLFPAPLRRYVGEPPSMTPLVLVTAPITYRCKLHKHEVGVIAVTSEIA